MHDRLMNHQSKAVHQMHNGCVLHGGVGVGKTTTALGYYLEKESPKDIYVITTARKRNELDWIVEAAHFNIFIDRENSIHGAIKVDSWNNIGKYVDVEGAFFIFDEQRLVSGRAWVKSFYKIAKRNHWILLSATPGDTWMDYAPIFIANGFYKNITEFKRMHVQYEPKVKFPLIIGYFNTYKLEMLRNHVLVEMPFVRHTKRVMNWIDVDYDAELSHFVWKKRWHPVENRPLKDVNELFRVLRWISNTDPSRLEFIRKLLVPHDKLIVFYNFDYELEIMRTLKDEVNVLEYNGHKKDVLPKVGEWVYLVQYVAGAEAWNCTLTDAIAYYSLTYSYRNFEQSQGRIDRLDTKFNILKYYMLVSNSRNDVRAQAALANKKDFNEMKDLRKSPEGREILEWFEKQKSGYDTGFGT